MDRQIYIGIILTAFWSANYRYIGVQKECAIELWNYLNSFSYFIDPFFNHLSKLHFFLTHLIICL